MARSTPKNKDPKMTDTETNKTQETQALPAAPTAPVTIFNATRDQVLAALSNVKTVRLNTGNHGFFILTDDVTNREAPVRLALNIYRTEATFGGVKTPPLSEFPTKCLRQIYDALQRNILINITDPAKQPPPIRRAVQRGTTVRDGKDPILAANMDTDDLRDLLATDPKAPNPIGIIMDRVKGSIEASTWDNPAAVVHAMSYMERTSARPRQALIDQLTQLHYKLSEPA